MVNDRTCIILYWHLHDTPKHLTKASHSPINSHMYTPIVHLISIVMFLSRTNATKKVNWCTEVTRKNVWVFLKICRFLTKVTTTILNNLSGIIQHLLNFISMSASFRRPLQTLPRVTWTLQIIVMNSYEGQWLFRRTDNVFDSTGPVQIQAWTKGTSHVVQQDLGPDN